MALQRLAATLIDSTHFTIEDKTQQTPDISTKTGLALVCGRTDIPIWTRTLGDVIDDQAAQHGSKAAAIFPWQSKTLSYGQLSERSKLLACAMLEMGLQHGDCVGILAGNCYEYIEIFLGGSRVGCPIVVLNSSYTPKELRAALINSCK